MNYKILSIYSNEENNQIEPLLIKSGLTFDFSKIKMDDLKKLEKAKSQHAIFIDYLDVDLKKQLNLYTNITYVKGNNINTLVCYDAFSSYENGFNKNSSFGREAFDKISYSELEIERIARTAFEASQGRNKHVTLIDKANSLATSKLFRKIISDINEDYPDVYVDMMTLEEAILKIDADSTSFDTIIIPSLFADTIISLLTFKAEAFNQTPTASLGETNLGLYEISKNDKKLELGFEMMKAFSFEN